MSITIIIKDYKAFAVSNYDSEKETEIVIDSLLPYLNCEVIVNEGTLFDDIWKLIEADFELYSIIFSHALGNHPLSVYIDQYKKPPKSEEGKDPTNRVIGIEAYWDSDVSTWEGKVNFDFSPSLHGYGPQTDHGFSTEEGKWSLSFTPINDYKGNFFRLQSKHRLVHLNLDIKRSQDSSEIIFEEVHTTWTIYDMLYAIFDEISWNGYPENQMRELQKLEQIIEDVKNNPERLISLEDTAYDEEEY